MKPGCCGTGVDRRRAEHLVGRLRAGVRIFMCPTVVTWTVAKVLAYTPVSRAVRWRPRRSSAPRCAPGASRQCRRPEHNDESNKENDEIAQLTADVHRNTIRASVLLIPACQDNQLRDGDADGLHPAPAGGVEQRCLQRE